MQNLGIYLSLQCLLFMLTMFLDREAEPANEVIGFLDTRRDAQNNEESQGLLGDQLAFPPITPLSGPKLNQTLQIMWRAIKMPSVYCTLLFFIGRGIIVPNLDEATYYYS